jgi:hypothetical protein
VDTDESGWYVNAAMPRMGHSPLGIVARKPGYSRRTGYHITSVAACDARVGIILNMNYNRGTTKDKFLIFINELIKSLQGTGKRVIMMDNLNTHNGEVENLINMSGHMLVFRPTYSPDFAPIEWCFKCIDDFII